MAKRSKAFGMERASMKALDQLEGAQRAMIRTVPKAGDEALVDAAEMVVKLSKAAVRSRPGVSGGGYRREPESISSRESVIIIAGGGTMVAAEFGTAFHFVGGRRVSAGAMTRRVFPVPRRDGWVVQPTIKKQAGKIVAKVRDDMLDESTNQLRKAGIR